MTDLPDNYPNIMQRTRIQTYFNNVFGVYADW